MKTKQKIVYSGRRFSAGKMYQRFVIFGHDGKLTDNTYAFSKVKEPIIGATYHADIDGERVSIQREPAIIEELGVDEDIRDAWWAEDRANYSTYKATKKQTALSKAQPEAVKRAIRALLPICKRLDYSDIRGLINYIVQEANREMNKERNK